VGYHKADLDNWIAARPRHASTSEFETLLRGPGRPRKGAQAVA
jgi:hypothetical protein